MLLSRFTLVTALKYMTASFNLTLGLYVLAPRRSKPSTMCQFTRSDQWRFLTGNRCALEFASEELRADRYIVNFAKSTRPQRLWKLWKLVTVRFFANLFVKKLQRRVKEHERAYKRQRRR